MKKRKSCQHQIETAGSFEALVDFNLTTLMLKNSLKRFKQNIFSLDSILKRLINTLKKPLGLQTISDPLSIEIHTLSQVGFTIEKPQKKFLSKGFSLKLHHTTSLQSMIKPRNTQ